LEAATVSFNYIISPLPFFDEIFCNLHKAGVADSVTMRITGHSSREMFDRYNTADKEDLRKTVA